MEKLFFGKNADSAFKLGHVRGVVLALAEKNNCELGEYAARYVKKNITGNGGATKENVRFMVCQLLGLKDTLTFDEADALALALSRIQQIDVNRKIQGAMA